uniref:Uncharacterized protein n=1 Tax=Moniliophthora roreri TaxID=221103 RepID=A0A0W0F8H1_MONRR
MLALTGSPNILPSTQSSLLTKGYIACGLFALSTLVTVTLWPYLRSQYPCLTLAELNTKEKEVDSVYADARSSVSLLHFAYELEDLSRMRIELKRRASQLRYGDFGTRSLWKVYLGFHPNLVPDLVAWYMNAEDLECDILRLMETDFQYRLEVELRQPLEAVNWSSIILPAPPAPTTQRGEYGSSFHKS